MTFFLHKASGTLSSDFFSFGLITSGSIAEASAQGFWHTGIDNMWSFITTFMGTDVHLTGTSTSSASAQFKQTTKTSTVETLVGTSANPSLPQQVAEVATFRTAMASKGSHGRLFLPPAATNAVAAGGAQTAAFTTAMVSGIKALMDALVLNGLSPVLLNRAALTTTAITSFDVPDHFVTQRRRRSKVIVNRTTSPL